MSRLVLKFALAQRLVLATASAVPTSTLLVAGAPHGSVARAGELPPGHARAKVLATSTSMEAGLLKTTYRPATTVCRAATCSKLGEGSV